MLITVFHIVATIVAGLGLWVGWRRMPRHHGIRAIVGWGLLARAGLGLVLFWVSYLHVPIAPSLQLGDGYWFFGIDGKGYFLPALEAARRGIGAVVSLDPLLPSVFFTKTLAVLVLLFGPTMSVALLLNAFSHLGVCALFVKFSERFRTGSSPLVFALIAVSFSPSWILWALQPMKETFSNLITVAFVYAFGVWIDAVTSDRASVRAWIGATAWLGVLLYALAGIRWYVALMLLLSSVAVAAWLVYRSTGRRAMLAVSGIVLVVALAQMFTVGAGPYLPRWAEPLQRPTASRIVALPSAPTAVVATMESARKDVLILKGGTDILIVRHRRSGLPADDERPEAVRPETTAERIFAGSVAMVVPRWLASRFQWIKMGGGRGLWIFAETDTIVFDATCAVAFLLVWRRLRRGGVPHPLFWHVAMTTVLLTAPLVYTAANFGTLFRQRAMVTVCAVLLPLAIGRASGDPD
jgi:hypothetical protein